MQIDAEQIKSLIDYFETQAEQQREYIKNCIEGNCTVLSRNMRRMNGHI